MTSVIGQTLTGPGSVGYLLRWCHFAFFDISNIFWSVLLSFLGLDRYVAMLILHPPSMNVWQYPHLLNILCRRDVTKFLLHLPYCVYALV
jgi:hypothetical protein